MKSESIGLRQVNEGNGKSDWHMSYGGHDSGPGHYSKIDVPAKSTADFTFTIAKSGNVTFSNDPIWVQAGTAKPTTHVVDVITNVAGGGTKALTFHDPNPTDQTLTYVLNFSDNSTLDPVIKNNGGGGTGYPRDAVYLVIGAVVLLALVALAFRAMRSRAVSDGPAR